MLDFLGTPAFHLWGSPATWLELVAATLGIAMVFFNMRVSAWGWPLAIASSLLYAEVFFRNRLYAEAFLQVVFIAMGLWGWMQWLRGRRADGSALRVAWLSPRGRLLAIASVALAWPTLALLLMRYTDSDVPWWDAFPTAGSLLGTFLGARKFVEVWAVWLVVNTVSLTVFAYKGLWLTFGLYTVFAVLSVLGWRAWRARVALA